MPAIDWTKSEEYVSTKVGKGKDGKEAKPKNPRVVDAVRDGSTVHYKPAGANPKECGISSCDARRFDSAWKKK